MSVVVAPRANMMEAFAAEMAAVLSRQGSKAVSSTPVGPYMHGPNGLWSVSGLDNQVISTRVKPRGLAGALAARGTNVMNPMYPFLTGFTAGTGSEPTGVCDDPPLPGQMKNAVQTAVFGRYSRQTPVLDITRIGQIINRSEFTDFALVNDPLYAAPGNPTGITVPASSPGSLSLMSDIGARFVGVGLEFQRLLMRQLYTGNPANNTAGGGYEEFAGLDRLIRTGIRDAITGQTAPSLDSIILNENYKKVTDTSGNDNIVNVLTYLMRVLRNTASRTGLDPVTWVIAMRETLFYELTAVWPCNYLTYRCIMNDASGTGTANNLNLDAGDAIGMRDAMRQGQYLVVDGMQFNVVLDDAIDEETAGDTNRITNSCFASDIYILPLSAHGINTLYWEYFDWSGPGAAMSELSSLPQMSQYYWSDGGQYLWHAKPPTWWCVQWGALIRPRLVLRTPHLAAKIQHVQYCPLMHPRDAFTDDPYFVNGGVTSRTTAPSLYSSYNAS